MSEAQHRVNAACKGLTERATAAVSDADSVDVAGHKHGTSSFHHAGSGSRESSRSTIVQADTVSGSRDLASLISAVALKVYVRIGSDATPLTVPLQPPPNCAVLETPPKASAEPDE